MLFKSRLKCLYGSLVNYVLAGSEFQSVTVLVMKLFLYVFLLLERDINFLGSLISSTKLVNIVRYQVL